MELNLILPFVTTFVMVIFTVSVFRRWFFRRRDYFLFWGIGLGMFTAASFAEAYFAAVGWSSAIFFIWYFFGAVLTAAWIGHGTYLLLVRKSWRHVVTGVLIAASLGALVLMLQVMPDLDPSQFDQGAPLSEQYKTDVIEEGDTIPAGAELVETEYRGELVTAKSGILPLGAPIRITTIFFNVYGTIMLVGGALWSSWLFLRKGVLPNRALGNVLIALGAILIASASTLTRLGVGDFLYIGELIAAILMYAGFTLAARPSPEEESSPEPASAAA
jgi:drug/metabolite transporter (DMT)-like permease